MSPHRIEMKSTGVISHQLCAQVNAVLGTSKKCRLQSEISFKAFQAVTLPTLASSRIYNTENMLMLEGAN